MARKPAAEGSEPKTPKTEEEIIMATLNFFIRQRRKLSPAGQVKLSKMMTGLTAE